MKGLESIIPSSAYSPRQEGSSHAQGIGGKPKAPGFQSLGALGCATNFTAGIETGP
jgi:hypothetical protein